MVVEILKLLGHVTSNDAEASILFSIANDYANTVINTLNIDKNGSGNGNGNDDDTNTHDHVINANTNADTGDGATLHHMRVIVEEETSDLDQLNIREAGTTRKELYVTDLYLDAVTMTGKKNGRCVHANIPKMDTSKDEKIRYGLAMLKELNLIDQKMRQHKHTYL